MRIFYFYTESFASKMPFSRKVFCQKWLKNGKFFRFFRSAFGFLLLVLLMLFLKKTVMFRKKASPEIHLRWPRLFNKCGPTLRPGIRLH